MGKHEKPLEVNELIVDDADLMFLDTEEKRETLYQFIGAAIATLSKDFPEAHHFVYVRIGV